jgi:hypothetical protein
MADFMQMMEAMKVELATEGNIQQHAMNDPLCLLYYPMRSKCYWWSIVMLLRPTVIAIAYNARNRDTGALPTAIPALHSTSLLARRSKCASSNLASKLMC